MKLHKVQLHNLNSLYGAHTIDFDAGIAQAPLFLIIGPTGSGKSTILDAICLALFGQTPRLDREHGKSEVHAHRYAHNIMSYGTGMCFAKVEFSKRRRDGTRQRYRATWTCRRARGKASGNVQKPTRKLELLHHNDHDEVVELLIDSDQPKHYQEPFDAALEHLRVDDFKRSILLAQGEFAAFLRADESVKASILERLTNTDQYKTIGQRAAAKRQETRREKEALEAKLDGLKLLTQEECAQLHLRQNTLMERLKESKILRQNAASARDWLRQNSTITQDLERAQTIWNTQNTRRAAHAEMMTRVEEYRTYAPVLEVRQRIDALQQELQKLTLHVKELELDQHTYQMILGELEHTLNDAKSTHKHALHAWERAQPKLERLQVLSAKLEGILEQRMTHARRMSEQRKTLQEATQTWDMLRQQFEASIETQHVAQQAHDALAHALPLLKQQGILEHEVKHLTAERNKQKARKEDIATQTKKRDAHAKICTDLESKHAAQLLALEPYKKRVLDATSALQLMLKDQPNVRSKKRILEEEAQDLRTRITTTNDVLRRHQELVVYQSNLLQAQEDRRDHEKKLVDARATHAKVHTQLEHTRNLLKEQERLRDTIQQALAISDARNTLSLQHPCPLCGSQEHPFILDNARAHAALKDLESKREALYARLDTTQTMLKTCEEEHISITREIATQEQSLTTSKNHIRAHTQTISKALIHYNNARASIGFKTIDCFPLASGPREALHTEILNAELSTRALLDEHIQTQHALDEAQEALHTAKEELRGATHKNDEANVELQCKKQEHLRMIKDLNALHAKFEEHQHTYTRMVQELVQKFVHCGITIDLEADEETAFLDAMVHAKERTHRFQESSKELLTCKEASKQLEQRLRMQERDVESAKKAVEDREREHAELEQHSKTLEAQRQATLGDDITDINSWRQSLEYARHTAQSKLESIKKNRAEVEAKHARTQAILEERRLQHASLCTQTTTLEQKLQEQLHTLGLEDVDKISQKLLTPQELQEWSKIVDEIKQACTRASDTLERLKKTHTDHESKRPELEHLTEHTSQAWEEMFHTQETNIETLQRELGALHNKLEEHKEATHKALLFKEKLEEKRHTYRIWDMINTLIGVNDGERFKKFAQSLNLQELVDRANVRLERLAPRYSLGVARGAHGEPRLDFVVCDSQQANFERPLTTLSGGETFLVSLALALALSDFKRLSMPIETLLLDEGFGTLDQDTLDVAMSTLRQLQLESSRQIGIISHVEGLKERIDTRILVEKKGSGRSTVRVEQGAHQG